MSRPSSSLTAPGVLLGMGLGGFADGIVLHQILQWHHLVTDAGEPATSLASLERNTFWDGVFHAATWVLVVAGLALLHRRRCAAAPPDGRLLLGLLLVGWGVFNLVEGVIDHHVLTLHHVREDVADPLPWDLGFLAFGALLLIAGWSLSRPRRVVDVTEPAPEPSR